jgi:hypothetical protein
MECGMIEWDNRAVEFTEISAHCLHLRNEIFIDI